MRALLNLSVATRLTIAFGMLVALLMAVAGLAWMQMATMRGVTHEITENWLPSVAHVNQMNTATSDFRVFEFQHVLNTDDAAMAAVERSLAGALATLEEHERAYSALISSDAERELYESFEADWKQYLQVHAQVLAHSRKNENTEARALLQGDSQRLFDRSSETLLKLVDLNQQGADAAKLEADAAYATARGVLLAAAGLAIALSIALAVMLTRGLIQQLGGEPGEVVRFAKAISEGDLEASLAIRTGDSSSIVAAMQSMRNRLTEIVTNVRSASDSVSAGARQLSTGNDDLSQRTQEQAAALEETASSMEEMTATVKQNSDNARQANQLASGARTHAERGGDVMTRAVNAMNDINSSSRKIADIISVIDEIAFQTNLLALNAAVEAARAGEQGRGFAVVASEVRNLAQRSASAAKEIKSLIEDSVDKVQTGSALVDESGKALREIMEGIKKVSDIVAEMAAAGEEQATGIEQVNTAVMQMDETTQQNAALVEEAAAAAKSMEQQAQQVVAQVSFFRVKSAGVPVATKVDSSNGPSQRPVQIMPVVRANPNGNKRIPTGRASAVASVRKVSGADSAFQEF
jgi:methyl-accepting chemotaxis protein